MDDETDLDYDYVGPDEWGTYPEGGADDTDCIDSRGNLWPEHWDDGWNRCRRCDAEMVWPE